MPRTGAVSGQPGGQRQRAAAEQVDVSVEHALPGLGAGVRDEPVPRLGDALGLGQLPRGRRTAPQARRFCAAISAAFA